jgi:hypothetical protein
MKHNWKLEFLKTNKLAQILGSLLSEEIALIKFRVLFKYI